MDDYQLSAAEIERLKKVHSQTKTQWEADRIKAVVLLGQGWAVNQVAQALLKDEQTVRSYFQHYKEGKTENLLQNNYHGRESSLNETQEKELTEHLRENLYNDSKSIINYIEIVYKVKYSPSGIKHLLERLNFTYHKTKRVPGKADKEEQRKWIKKYRFLRSFFGKTAVFLFGDACHPQCNGEPAYGWIYKGEEKKLKTNSGRQHLNINGVIDIDTREWISEMPARVNAQSMICLGKKILRKYKDKIVYWIVDNAGYHTSKVFSEWLSRQGNRIRMLPLPSYSPNLNPMERLWKFFNEKVRHNVYYERFSDFVSAAKKFFRCRTRFRTELLTRITENFHNI